MLGTSILDDPRMMPSSVGNHSRHSEDTLQDMGEAPFARTTISPRPSCPSLDPTRCHRDAISMRHQGMIGAKALNIINSAPECRVRRVHVGGALSRQHVFSRHLEFS